MTGIIDWAGNHARMVIAFIVMSITAGAFAYVGLPKEGEPDIEIPAIFISVPFPGISASDAEKLIVKPIETEMADLDGLKTMSGTAQENYAGVALEFEFGWDKTKIIADIRDAMNTAEADFPAGAEKYSINEINFSEFPIIVVNMSGQLPERTLVNVAKDLQDRLEALDAVLEAGLAGHRDEMVEVLIDPLRLEAYNVTAAELINVVVQNNQLIAADQVETPGGAFAVKIPSSFDETQDIYNLPVKTNGDRVVTLGDLAEIRLTFEDRAGTARFNGENTVALQVVKRKGFNIIDTSQLIKDTVEEARAEWPEELREAITVGTSLDQSRTIASMVSQLEGSVLTAIALVMIVVLAFLGTRSALLVGFAIPTSFLLCFVLLGLMGIAISNIVMFGLILAVGMLVDGAIVVVEYADRRIKEGTGPMTAFTDAAKRMFWPVVSSTATTLCAFLPMLFWPGVPGQFMGMLPVTLIFVLSASLIVALIYLPVMGGVFGRFSRALDNAASVLRPLPWAVRAVLVPITVFVSYQGLMQMLNPARMMGDEAGAAGVILGALLFFIGASTSSVTMTAASITRDRKRIRAGYRRTPFGHFIKLIAGNPVMPVATIAAVVFFVVSVFGYFSQNNNGVEFFVESEPEQAIIYVRARGNLSLDQQDALVKAAERIALDHPGIDNAFSFAGSGGLNNNTGGAEPPLDTIGQVQLELVQWEKRPEVSVPWFTIPVLGVTVPRSVKDPEWDGDKVLEDIRADLKSLPGVKTEILNLAQGPASAKPVHLRIKGENWQDLLDVTADARAQFEATPGLKDIEDTLPLPGIDWQIDVDVEKAGRYGADVVTVGGMVQLVTRGLLLDTMRVDSSDEEIEIRVRLPEEDRVLSTLDDLKVRTPDGLVPLSNFVTRQPVEQLGRITRVDQKRYFDVKAAVTENLVSLQRVVEGEAPERLAVLQAVEDDDLAQLTDTADKNYVIFNDLTGLGVDGLSEAINNGAQTVPVNPNDRIAVVTEWLEATDLPAGVSWEWTGDQEDQEESGQFLMTAFAGALALMFVILLAQFNSFYNAVLVLLAVILSTTGVLIGMLVMNQPFSIIMTGTGIVALAGIVVNNNIVLIDTYQEFSRYMPRIEAIIRTAEQRIRPVLLTTITTMAGLASMMYGLSFDFFAGGYSIDSPTALWWKQLATAVVFGLGIATVLTLVFTPSMLALRVWAVTYLHLLARVLARLSMGRTSQAARDWALRRSARRTAAPEIIWADGLDIYEPGVKGMTTSDPNDRRPKTVDLDTGSVDETKKPGSPLRAAE
ncbi:acriflavine resistance protein B [Actibacterium mucosum KCTC 23349]|uniref:Acriflavine resistance protein B n=1 Tax=Actibacterium mucosum KCTC 23349 TaxID=1454373 RepID=A0A037ZGR3_9RHOB|nr:efflux RND transporter permease subunit [Actibacterium mucosum]KAJ55650.1 acriflavine resistance protein B [Actibacterium mucosum KCTC 23349]